jgi:hypothetical protein
MTAAFPSMLTAVESWPTRGPSTGSANTWSKATREITLKLAWMFTHRRTVWLIGPNSGRIASLWKTSERTTPAAKSPRRDDHGRHGATGSEPGQTSLPPNNDGGPLHLQVLSRRVVWLDPLEQLLQLRMEGLQIGGDGRRRLLGCVIQDVSLTAVTLIRILVSRLGAQVGLRL